MQSLRFIPYSINSGALNMAIDEALMLHMYKEKTAPTLRFYGWEVPTLSIGYFQKFEKHVNDDALHSRNIGFVRRPTGGRAVLHHKELTYSVTLNQALLGESTVSKTYSAINKALVEGFKLLGINAYLSVVQTAKRGSSPVCFEAPSDYEVMIDNKKVAGSAQMRANGILMQHGSIIIELDEDLIFSALKFPSKCIEERARRDFKDKAVSINSSLNTVVSLGRIQDSFLDGFSKAFEVDLYEDKMFQGEESIAFSLYKSKYNTDEWNYLK